MGFKELCNLAKNSLGYADNWTKNHNELVKNYRFIAFRASFRQKLLF